jgi:hypothetical protein
MKKNGRKHGINPILTFKRGGNFSPLFILLFSLFSLHGYCDAQFYSAKLFPDPFGISLNKIEKPEYSINTFYDHAYKHSINDTTISHIYRAMVFQNLNLPLKNKSIFSFGHSYNDYYTGYRDHTLKQHLYNKQTFHDLNLGYSYFDNWYNINLHYGYEPSNKFQDIRIGFALEYKGFTLQPKYQSMTKTISSYFNADTMGFDIKNFIDHKSYSLAAGYLGNDISANIKISLRSPNPDAEINDLGLGLNIGTSRIQYDSRINYKIRKNIKVWGSAFYQRDTCEVPIYWSDRKLGEFTAIDDTLWSVRIGLDINHHNFAVGKGHWYGKLWISQLSPSPLLAVWATLSGTKYYLDLGSDVRFTGLFYSYQFSNQQWESSVGINSLNFSGSIDGEHWAITFPFILTVHDKLDVQIHKLNIIESSIEISKQVSTRAKVKFWSNILLPINIDITVKPKLPEIPSEEDEKISGGLQFGLSFSYYLKGD